MIRLVAGRRLGDDHVVIADRGALPRWEMCADEMTRITCATADKVGRYRWAARRVKLSAPLRGGD